MNVIAKQAAVSRLRKAMELEKLSTKETAGCLGLNPTYVSMFFNEKLWSKCPAHAFDRLIHWCNHGTTLKGYSHPEGTYGKVEQKNQEPVIKVKPEALKRLRKKIEELPHDEVTPEPEFKEADAVHIELKPGEEVEFRRTLKDEHQDSPVKTGEYIDLVEAIKLVAERLPENVSIEIRINAKEA